MIHEVIVENDPVTLRCPHSVGGAVTWSRESGGRTVDIITSAGDNDINHIKDPFKHYSLLADKSLHIIKPNVSFSGRYLCNNEPAVDLTVIPSGNIKLYLGSSVLFPLHVKIKSLKP